ncbi:hypothetical protein VKT23_009401 [Stygiomarasmius scandens]|uniref:Uncharacterized protein n=1 Tax=Marasmiellus scandens TaxID=2682957 RepID=A0ABR1JG80_9AGAR
MEEPSEQTALLASDVCLPAISSAIVNISTLEHDELNELHSSNVLRPSELSNHRTLQVAYSLIVLLSLRAKTQKDSSKPSRNPWDKWSAENGAKITINSVDNNIQLVWNGFLNGYCKPQDIDVVLWTPFRVEDGKEKTLRVVDFLTHPSQAPSEFFVHRLIYLSLLYRWQNGPLVDFTRSRNHLRDRYDALGTPKVLHAIELVGHLFFLILLISYTLHPPNKPVVYAEFIGWGEGVLIFLSVTLSLQKPSSSNIPFYLTLFAFLFALPSVPFPENASFSFMLISVFILLFQFHLLRTPSPLLLFSRSRTLPFVTFLHYGVSRTIGSLLLFFLPAFLVSVLLSSLADTPFPPFRLQRAMITAPIETRVAYLFLSSVVITIFIICFLITIPLSVSYTSSTDTWDRYSVAIGNAARATFFREVVKYSQSYYFPSPFNCVHLVFIRIPTLAFRTFRVAPAAMEGFERMVWRITVGPFAAVTKLLTIPLP